MFTILLLAFSANAQVIRTCAAEEILQKQLAKDPLMRQVREALERRMQNMQGKQDRGSTVITIPVVVNVLWRSTVENISAAQIQTQIDVLNADFRLLNGDATGVPSVFNSSVADCEINFCLAKKDPTGCPTDGIRRRETTKTVFNANADDVKFTNQGGLDVWDRDQYLNIWVCNINSNPLGYAQFPGGPAATDGVVVDYRYFGAIGTATAPYNLGRTATHEIGHWFNCFHIWGDDGSGCGGSDMVGDTPNQADEHYGCPSFPQVSCSNGSNGDMFMNYMDYTDDACMFMFTKGQKTRMQATFDAGGPRNALLSSTGCEVVCPCTDEVTHIYQNTTYNEFYKLMAGDIIVHSGAELTIEGIVGFKENARILVERNARLIIANGGVVTRGCNAPNWAGIQVLGNNNKIQPEHDAPLTDPDQAGIVRVTSGSVLFARCGITAGGGYGQEYWGGLIWTHLADFRDNRKDVEFMSYKFSLNKSRFNYSSFSQFLDPFVNTEGVTIWETDGIEFRNCRFNNKDFEGIRTYDAGIKVLDDCRFIGNETGISSYATYPMTNKTVIGSGTSLENTFTKNKYHVHASLATGLFGLYSNGKFSLDVINNNFTDGDYGVIVDGPSNFRIAGNKFTGVPIGSWAANTGFNNMLNQNLIGCNQYKQGTNIGILTIGDNKQMQFLANDFNMSGSGRDFVLTSSLFPNTNGAIAALQGNPFVPASNCFTDPGTQVDILTAGQWGGSTEFFTYHYQSGEPPVNCDPEPLTPGNYGKALTPPGPFIVDCARYGGLPIGIENPTLGDLIIKRTQLQQLMPIIATNPSAKVQYYQALQDKEAILKHLLGLALDSKDYITAEILLTGEQTKAANWAIFGLRMDRKDYTSASQWLSQLPTQNDADIQFRDIQLINIQRLQNLATFQLSATQETYLNTVAESTSPVRGYARGILGLLKDRRFYPEAYELGEERSTPAEAIAQESIKLYPVPATNSLVVVWPPLQSDAITTLQVFDMLGRSLILERSGINDTQRTLNTSQLSDGVYYLVISDKDRPVHRAKFTVQH